MLRTLLALLVLGMFLGVSKAHASTDFAACGASLPYGAPTMIGDPHVTPVCHPGYAALVDDEALVARWVAYPLTAAHTLGCEAPTTGFHADEQLPSSHRARPEDYEGGKFARGQEAPAEDFAWSDAEEHDSLAMTNVAPQLPELKGQDWQNLETAVRAWAWKRGALLVMSGAVLGEDAQKIGPDGVAVPSAFWKVLVDTKMGQAIGFMMPQADVPKDDLLPWERSVGAIENEAGIKLPLPAGIDHDDVPDFWGLDARDGWNQAHAAACPHTQG